MAIVFLGGGGGGGGGCIQVIVYSLEEETNGKANNNALCFISPPPPPRCLHFSADSCLSLFWILRVCLCVPLLLLLSYTRFFFFVHGVFGVLWIGGFATDTVWDRRVAAAAWLSGCVFPPIVMGNVQNKKKQNEYIHICVCPSFLSACDVYIYIYIYMHPPITATSTFVFIEFFS